MVFIKFDPCLPSLLLVTLCREALNRETQNDDLSKKFDSLSSFENVDNWKSGTVHRQSAVSWMTICLDLGLFGSFSPAFLPVGKRDKR